MSDSGRPVDPRTMIPRARLKIAVAAAALLVWLAAGSMRADAANTLFPDQSTTPLGNASCSEIGGTPGFTVTTLVSIIFESSVAQGTSFNLTIYSNSACDVTHELYQTGQAGAGAVILLTIPLSTTHLWYTMSNLSGDGFRIIYS